MHIRLARISLFLLAICSSVLCCTVPTEADVASPDGSPGQDRANPPTNRQNRDFRLMGWATADGGTSGGDGGKTVTVSRPEDLVKYLRYRDPLIIQIDGMLDLGLKFPGCKSTGRYYVESNKTILGLGSTSGIHRGELRLSGVTNVIIRNLNFSGARDTAIAITDRTTHVWIDHNNLSSAEDGLVDITRGADLVTVSWNRFFKQNKVSLVGAGDLHAGDQERLRVTFHHNWFHGTRQRHPRVRYGRVHLFNNLYENVVAGVGIGVDAQIVSTGNFFENSRIPYQFHDTKDRPGHMKDTGSRFGKTNLRPLQPTEAHWSPRDHYSFTAQDSWDVPDLVRKGAGTGIINTPAATAAAVESPIRQSPAQSR